MAGQVPGNGASGNGASGNGASGNASGNGANGNGVNGGVAGAHVLVVDDEPAITDLLSTALRYMGYQVTTAATGTAALEAAATANPDLVVLPDEPYAFSADDGPEAFPDTRCVLVSGRHLTWYGPSLVEAREVLELR
jgi:hypothetical protein